MKARIMVEFDIADDEFDSQSILNNVVLYDDDVIDGFCITTNFMQFDNTSKFFLSNGQILKKELIEKS